MPHTSFAARYLWLFTFAFLTIFLPATPARADKAAEAAACFALVGGPTGAVAASLARGDLVKQLEGVYSNAQQASEASARYAEKNCITWQNNPVFQALAATLTAMVADKKLSPTYGDAKKEIDAAIGKIVADLVKGALGNPNSPLNALAKQLPSDFVSRLENYIKTNATDSIDTMLRESPFTAQLLSMFDCAVVVATSGAADEIKKKIEAAKQTKSDIQDCASFLASCTSPGDCLGAVVEFGEALGKGVANLPGELWALVKQVYQEAKEAVNVVINAPGKAKEWIECKVFKAKSCYGVAEPPQCINFLKCAPGHSREQCLGNAQQKSKFFDPSCSTKYACANGAPFQNVGGVEICPCPAGLGYYNGGCTACNFPGRAIDNGICKTWDCAPPMAGQTVSKGTKYKSCNYAYMCQGRTVWRGDSKTGSCQPCGTNTVFVKSTSGVPSCQPCAYNETSQPGGACQPLKCAPLTHPDKANPHVCVQCKDVQQIGNLRLCLDGGIGQIDCPPGTTLRPDGRSCMEIPKTKGISKDIEQKNIQKIRPTKDIEQKAPAKNIEQNAPKTR